jgi:hypothetical protein
MTTYVPPGSLIAPINAGQFVADTPSNATPAPKTTEWGGNAEFGLSDFNPSQKDENGNDLQ